MILSTNVIFFRIKSFLGYKKNKEPKTNDEITEKETNFITSYKNKDKDSNKQINKKGELTLTHAQSMIGMESTWSKFSKLVDEFNNKENVVENNNF